MLMHDDIIDAAAAAAAAICRCRLLPVAHRHAMPLMMPCYIRFLLPLCHAALRHYEWRHAGAGVYAVMIARQSGAAKNDV